ncbi:MAG: insulinase family protein [Chloroflexi bacterium]|nr:insulinase family protein [Chloroflexota bacterium]
MFETTVLDNGLRVLTATMAHLRSVSVGIFIGAGSRYEDDTHAGISHFVEHMLFKGTERRPQPRDISAAIESVGGIINASTDRELTVYWAKVARPHFHIAFDVLMDIVRHPTLDPEALELERKVVFEELSMTNDEPREKVDVLIDGLLWPNQPMGRDVGGTKESVAGITREMLREYMACQYVPGNAVVAVAGNVAHAEVVDVVTQSLGDWAPGIPLEWYPAVDGQTGPRLAVEYRKTEQAHLCLAVQGLPSTHPDRYALSLLSAVLGEGMSSRLFVEMREKQGLAYDVHSSTSHFRDCGSVVVYAGVDPKRLDRAVETILRELGRLRDGVPAEELAKVKELLKGRLLLRMEDSRAVAGWLGAQEMLLGRVLTPEQVVERIDSVTLDDLARVAGGLVLNEKLNLAVVGPCRSQVRFQRILSL